MVNWGTVMSMETALERSVSPPAIADHVEPKCRLRACAKVCSVPIIVLLVIAALGPEKWAPRTQLGWQYDHFIGYFGITLFFCFAWPRPFVVGGTFMALAALLEGLQAFTPDRTAYLPAIFYGAGGALVAALIAEIFMRAWGVSGSGADVPGPQHCTSLNESARF
jgi:VanZ family protein